MSVADVRHDVNSMTPHERLRLAKLLNDRWRLGPRSTPAFPKNRCSRARAPSSRP